jgi:hypothetical protein
MPILERFRAGRLRRFILLLLLIVVGCIGIGGFRSDDLL